MLTCPRYIFCFICMVRREDGGVYTPPGILTSKNSIKLKPEPGIASNEGDKR